jgi:hypothetical protein
MSDWDVFETKLRIASIDAINRFADEHPDKSVCFFAFDSEPRYGYVLFAFDTFENNIRSARKVEQFTIKSRTDRLTQRRYWNRAEYYLCHPPVTVFNTNSGDFEFPQYAEVRFPEWEAIGKSGGIPKQHEHDDDYLDSNVRILFWNTAQYLIAESAFDALKMARPFMIGYGIHDQEEQILRVLNWPDAEQNGPGSCGV